MPFFENAQGVNIRGGTFNDNHGPQNNHIYSADHNAYYDTGHREDAAPALALKILSARRESNIVQQQAIGGQGYPRITDRQASVFSDSNASETYFSPGPADSRQFSHRLNSSSVTSPQRSYAENTFQHAPHPHTPRYSPSPSTPSPRPASQSPPPCRSNRSCHRSALPSRDESNAESYRSHPQETINEEPEYTGQLSEEPMDNWTPNGAPQPTYDPSPHWQQPRTSSPALGHLNHAIYDASRVTSHEDVSQRFQPPSSMNAQQTTAVLPHAANPHYTSHVQHSVDAMPSSVQQPRPVALPFSSCSSSSGFSSNSQESALSSVTSPCPSTPGTSLPSPVTTDPKMSPLKTGRSLPEAANQSMPHAMSETVIEATPASSAPITVPPVASNLPTLPPAPLDIFAALQPLAKQYTPALVPRTRKRDKIKELLGLGEPKGHVLN